MYFQDRGEFFITPFPFVDWRDLWRIKCVGKDHPGLVNAIVDVLQAFQLNILAQSGKVLGKFHYSEFIVSARAYESEVDGGLNERGDDLHKSLRLVEMYLLAEFLDELRFSQVQRGPHGPRYEPDLRIERMRRHYDLFQEHEKRLKATLYMDDLLLKPEEDNEKNVWITLPDYWYEELIEGTGYEQGDDQQLWYIVGASERDQIVDLHVPHKNSQHFKIRIKHQDRIGAIYAFTEVLKTEFNLVYSSTVKLTRVRNRFEFICEPLDPSEKEPVKKIQQAMNDEKVESYRPTTELLTDNKWVPLSSYLDSVEGRRSSAS